MSGPYDDIIHLPHHVSATRSRMTMSDRAAQFSPFAALTGFDAVIQETGRVTDTPVDLDTDEVAALNEKIRFLAECLDRRPKVSVTYFVPDTHKSGGSYVHIMGIVKKIDPLARAIVMEDGEKICFDRIAGIEIQGCR